METETLEPNSIAAATAANIGITHTTGVSDDGDDNTPIFTPIKQTPDKENDNEHEDNEDGNE